MNITAWFFTLIEWFTEQKRVHTLLEFKVASSGIKISHLSVQRIIIIEKTLKFVDI